MRTCVYTALFGQYDGLIEQPTAGTSSCDFICFTDDAQLTSDTWDIRLVEGAFPLDPVRSARLFKILGDESLAEYDATLYVDASVLLRRPPEQIIGEWLSDDVDIALSSHSYREHLADEFDEVVRLNYDDRARVYEQLVDYSISCPDVLEARPLWTGMLVRRPTPVLAEAMRTWANHVLRYSRRDQLSVLVALGSSSVRTRVLELDNYDSPDHEWPVIGERRISQGKSPALPPGPLVVELHRAHQRIDALTASMAEFHGRSPVEVVASEEAHRARADEAEERLDAIARELADNAHELRVARSIRGSARNLGHALRTKLSLRVSPGAGDG